MAKKIERPQTEEEKQTLADVIREVQGGMRRLTRSGLNRRAIECLIHDNTSGVGKREIKAVLDSLDQLADWYTA